MRNPICAINVENETKITQNRLLRIAVEHYYSRKPETISAPQMIKYAVDGRELKFITDRSVFSKGCVDFGSDLLIKAAISEGFSGNVLDLGCGYGVIGLSLYMHNPNIRLVMIDINERAVELCKRNVELNVSVNCGGNTNANSSFTTNITVVQSDGFSEVANSMINSPCEMRTEDAPRRHNGFQNTRLFNHIYFNPPVRAGKDTVFRLYEECWRRLNNDGHLLVVIQKKQGMNSSFKELLRVFGNCEIIAKKSGYFVLRSIMAISV